MATLVETLQRATNMTNELIREAWSDVIIDAAFDIERSWFMNRIPRNSDGINGLTVNVPFITEYPGGWRGMDPEVGYTPTGAPFSSDNQTWSLGCCAATANITLKNLVEQDLPSSVLGSLIMKQLEAIRKAFPYFMRGMLWSSNDSSATVKNALGVVSGSPSGNVVTLDNAGLWHSAYAQDRAALFERGMFLAVYSSAGVLREGIRKVTNVDRTLGKITLDDVTDIADNDIFVFSDIAGMEVNGPDEFPGILDMIDDDNTFQGVDRSTNQWAQSYVENAAAAVSYDLLSAFFSRVYNPRLAYCHTDLVRKYFSTEIRDNVRYTGTHSYVDGYESVTIGNTQMVGDWDPPRDRVMVPDFDEMRIAQLGDLQNLMDEGWRRVQGRTYAEYVLTWWGRPVLEDPRRTGVLYGITGVV